MDRISDSGSDDYGSTPYGDTLPILNELIIISLRISLLILPAYYLQVLKFRLNHMLQSKLNFQDFYDTYIFKPPDLKL